MIGFYRANVLRRIPFNRRNLSWPGSCIRIAGLVVGLASPVYSQSNEPVKAGPEIPPATAGKGSPQVRVIAARHDFGEIWAGATLEHAFDIANDGNADLEILQVSPTCGCTTAGDYPRRIAPGKTGSIPFRLDSNKVHGQFAKSIHVTTNDPASPSITLTLAGNCRRKVEAKPPNAGFGRILDQQPHERVIVLTNSMPSPIKPELIRGSGPEKFKCKLDEVKPGREYRLTVRVEPPYAPGTISETLKIRTGDAATDVLTISAYAVIPSRVEVFPSVVLLPTATAMAQTSAPIARQLQLLNHGNAPVKLVSATATDAAVKVSNETVTAGKEYRLTVTVPKTFQPAKDGTFVTVRTDDKDYGEFRIPIRITGQASTPGAMAGANAARAGSGAVQSSADGASRIDEKITPKATGTRPALTMLNQPSPRFELETLGGQPVSPVAYAAHPATVLNFVAPNCGFCKRQLPEVERVREAFESRGVRFVNVMQTMKQTFTTEQIMEALANAGSRSEVALDRGNRVGAMFKATSFPSLYVVDAKGRIREVVSGAKANLRETLTRRLEDLLDQESPDPTAAKSPGD